MTVERPRQQKILFHRQLVITDQFVARSIDTFTINTVAAAKLSIPAHIAAPAIFINISSGNIGLAIIFSFKTVFVENGDTVLQRDIGEIVVVLIKTPREIEIVYTQQTVHFFERLVFQAGVEAILSPGSSRYIGRKQGR